MYVCICSDNPAIWRPIFYIVLAYAFQLTLGPTLKRYGACKLLETVKIIIMFLLRQ